jgi:hypothetical protein
MPGQAILELTRVDNRWKDRLRAYRVTVDGLEVGEIRRGETKDFPVEPGSHEVVLRIDWCRSPTLEVDVAPGTRVPLQCRPNVPIVLALIAIITRRPDWISLEKI